MLFLDGNGADRRSVKGIVNVYAFVSDIPCRLTYSRSGKGSSRTVEFACDSIEAFNFQNISLFYYGSLHSNKQCSRRTSQEDKYSSMYSIVFNDYNMTLNSLSLSTLNMSF